MRMRPSFRSLKEYAAREAVATPSSPCENERTLEFAEEWQAPEDGRTSTDAQSCDDEAAEPDRQHKRPAQKKLEKDIADFNMEIEMRSNISGEEQASRVVELKKLIAFSEYKLKRLRVGIHFDTLRRSCFLEQPEGNTEVQRSEEVKEPARTKRASVS